MSFTEKASQEISNIEHLQYKHDESDLSVSTRTAHKLAHCKKRRDIFERSDISRYTREHELFSSKVRTTGAQLFLYQYDHDHAKIWSRTSLLFCLSYSFFRLKTPVDLSNSDLNSFKWSSLVVSTLG